MPLFVLIVAVVLLVLGFTAFTGAPYVPSRRRELEWVFTKLHPLNRHDVVVDLGAGDGVVLRTVRQFGARAVGYEIGPVYALIARLLARGDAGQSILMKNYWHADFPADTTVVYVFSDGRDIAKVHRLVARQATRLNRQLVFITHGFAVPGVKADKTGRAYLLYRVNPCPKGEA